MFPAIPFAKHRPRVGVLLALAAGAVLLFAACDDDGADADGLGVTEGSNGTNGVNVDAILGDPGEVRLLLDQAGSAFTSEVIADTTYADGQLTVTVTEQIDGLDQAEQLCDDLSEAIAATDVSIHVQDQTGNSLAECRFDA